MSKQSETKRTHRRFQLLEFGEALGNISEACRRMDISRSQFYTYKKRYQKQCIVNLL